MVGGHISVHLWTDSNLKLYEEFVLPRVSTASWPDMSLAMQVQNHAKRGHRVVFARQQLNEGFVPPNGLHHHSVMQESGR